MNSPTSSARVTGNGAVMPSSRIPGYGRAQAGRAEHLYTIIRRASSCTRDF